MLLVPMGLHVIIMELQLLDLQLVLLEELAVDMLVLQEHQQQELAGLHL